MKIKTVGEQVVGELGKVIAVCEKTEEFAIGPELTLKKIKDTHSQLDKCNEELKTIDAELTALRDRRDDCIKAGKSILSRARKGILAFFGPDSTEYAQAGGTRLSEHKPRARKNKIVKAAA